MFKKLMLLAVSVTALVAFAVPAVAQGSAIITNAEGEAAQTITAFSSDTKSKTAGGTLFCNEIEMHIEISQNDTEKATGSGTGSAKHEGTQECEIVEAGAKVVTVTQVSIPHIQINGNGTGSATFTYVYDIPGPTKCHFEGTAGITYTAPTNKIAISGTLTGKKIEGAGNCSTTGSIAGNFTVKDETGGTPIIH